jgi:hypothetical protein
MKLKVTLTAMMFALTLSVTSTYAQSTQECVAAISLFTEPAKAKKLSRGH